MASKVGASKNLRRSPRAPSSRKRKIKESPPVAVPEPKRKCIEKKSLDGRDIDRYCWMCHQSGQDEKCFTCPRVYHTGCLKKASNVFSEEGVCPECQLDSIDGTKLSKTLTCQRLKELLIAATKQRKSGIPKKEYGIHKIFLSWPQNIGGLDELVRVIDFQILIDKINDIVPYTKTSEFFSDVKWMQHNCYILYGANSKVTDAAVKLVKAFKTDLLDLEACPECYYHMLCSTSADFFVRICDPPHDIIWAQVSGYPYWPAKCLKIVGGNAHVRFFGRHEIGDIPITQCYFISKAHPNHPQRNVPKTPKYNASIIELRQYVELYERTFGIGSFHYYPQKTAFRPENAVPKPASIVSDEAVPASKPSKPNIQALPIRIDLIAREEGRPYRDEGDESTSGNTAPITSSNAVTVSMTFSEEQSKTFSSDFDSSASFASTSIDSTYDTVQSIDIQSCTATTVVTSTPIVASSDSLINMSSDDLSLGAEFSNSNPVHESDDAVANNNWCNISKTSQILLQTLCNANEQILTNPTSNVVPSAIPSGEFVRELSSVVDRLTGTGQCSGNGSAQNDDDVIILDSSDSLPLPIHRPNVDDSLIVSYLASRGKTVNNLHRDFKSVIYTLFVNMWSLANSAPAAPEVLTTVIMDLKKQQDGYIRLKRENDGLKLCAERHQGVATKLQEKINTLKLLLDEEKRKNEDIRMEFNDATKNAKLVVDSVKRSSDNLWSIKFKEYSSIFNQKLAEKDNTISEYTEYLERLRADYSALEAQKAAVESMYEKALNELSALSPGQKFCAGTQTELLQSDIYLRADLDNYLEENSRTVKHNIERELNEQIIQAKLTTFCNTCLKPAKIHCCMSANYCTKSCQRKKSKAHAMSCQRQKETRPRQDSEVSQHQQFCHPMINQLNQTQTFARKTTSIHLQLEQSSEVITTANKEANLYVYPPSPSSSAFNAMYAAALEANNPINMPLNLMTTQTHLDRYALKPPLLPTPPPPLSTPGLMCPSSNGRRHT